MSPKTKLLSGLSLLVIAIFILTVRIRSDIALTPQQLLEREVQAHPYDFVRFKGQWRLWKGMNSAEQKEWGDMRHAEALQNYKPDRIGSTKDFFFIGNRYFLISGIFGFREATRLYSEYEDMPMTQVDVRETDGRPYIIAAHCSVLEFAEVMRKSGR